jgi:hypothetical protein
MSSIIFAGQNDFIISSGALDDYGIYDSFYKSPIFVGENNSLVISNAHTKAFVAHGTLFYSKDNSPQSIINSAKSPRLAHGFLDGFEDLGFTMIPLKNNPFSYNNAQKTRYAFEKRSHIMAFRLDNKPIIWPKDISEISEIPAVIMCDKESETPLLVSAKSVGSFSDKMRIINNIRTRNNKSYYLDLGLNEGLKNNINKDIIKDLARNKLTALFAGMGEMAQLSLEPEALKSLPLLYPLGDNNLLKKAGLNLWSLADQEKVWPLFTHLGALGRLDKINSSQQNELTIVRVFSENAALKAAQNIHVDLVLLAVDSHIRLAHRESIEKNNGELAPIIRIAANYISEVTINKSTHNSRVEIIRHLITNKSFVGSPLTLDTSAALPARMWHGTDFDKVLAKMMLKNSNADIAIFECSDAITPLDSALNFDLARMRLMRPGVYVSTYISGKLLKKIANLINKKVLTTQLVIFGFDTKNRTINQRPLNDAEKYKIALSEKALLELWGIAMLGGFSEEYAQRSIFAEQIAANLKSLFFLSGVKFLPIADTEEALQKTIKNFKAHKSFNNLINEELMRLSNDDIERAIINPAGEVRHTLTWAIDYFDIGISQTVGNQHYEKYQKEKRISSISRAGIPPLHAHLLLFSKMSLIYDSPHVEITLGNNTRYLHMNQDDLPERDKTIFSLDFRLPWERSLFKNKSVAISPVLKNSYETRIGPIKFLSKNKDKSASFKRPHVGESMLGAHFDCPHLGFNFDIGPVLAVDFMKSSAREALDIGPGLNFSGRWSLIGPLELSSILKASYLFSLPNALTKDKVALAVEGTTWLRLARFYDINVSLMADFFAATLQEKPKDFALSSIFGLTLSYGHFFRLFG